MIATEPNFSKTLSWLDKENNDDRIIASALEIQRSNPSISCFGQVSKSDSLTLLELVADFKTYVHNRDKSALIKMSLNKIHCIPCFNLSSKPPKKFLVPVEKFIRMTYDTTIISRLLKCIGKENPWIIPSTGKGTEFEDEELKKIKEVTLYDVCYLTTKPDEIQKGHEGQQTGLQFAKIGNEFKLYGLTTIP